MVYNYYQLVLSHVAGETRGWAEDRFIINNLVQEEPGKPDDLIYPDGTIAAYGYVLSEPLRSAMEGFESHVPSWDVDVNQSNWNERRELFSLNERQQYLNESGEVVVSEQEAQDICQPIIDSIEQNTPVVAYTGVSSSTDPATHIITISGYKMLNGDLWLRFSDPSSLAQDKRDEIGDDNLMSLVDADLPGASYWIRALRLFQPQSLTESNPDDLLCDYGYAEGESDEDMRGFMVWINEELQTPDSPYAHSLGLTTSLPVDLGEGLAVTPETVEHAYRIIETGSGGYFPVGVEQVWHGGVHLPTPGGADQLIHAPLPGRVVAARLDAESGRRNNFYGSHRFVLLAHDPEALFGLQVPDVEEPFGGEPLFSLLMHLGPPAVDPDGDLPADHDLAWLRGAPSAYRATAPLFASLTPAPTSAEPRGNVGTVFGIGDAAKLEPIPVLREVSSPAGDATWYAVRCPDGEVGYLHERTVTEHGDGTLTPDSLDKNVRPIPATTDAVWGRPGRCGER